MRLIDADVLEKEFDELRKCRGWCGADLDVLDIVKEDLIDSQPTAYDVDKVIEQLEWESYQEFCDSPRVIDLNDTMYLVRKGGVNE
jgi:hypothetical protein